MTEHLPGRCPLYRSVHLHSTSAPLAAIALEHGLEVCSADTDFARFTEIRWHNPLAA